MKIYNGIITTAYSNAWQTNNPIQNYLHILKDRIKTKARKGRRKERARETIWGWCWYEHRRQNPRGCVRWPWRDSERESSRSRDSTAAAQRCSAAPSFQQLAAAAVLAAALQLRWPPPLMAGGIAKRGILKSRLAAARAREINRRLGLWHDGTLTNKRERAKKHAPELRCSAGIYYIYIYIC